MKKFTHFLGALSLVALVSACSSTQTTAPKAPSEEELNRQAGIQVEQAGNNVRLILPNSTLFNTNEAVILPASEASLKRASVLLNRSKSVVSVEGHTDNQGTHDYNQKLSEKRADVVLKRLAELGVDATRMKSTGFSYDKPVAGNDTDEGRQKNRRTDVVLINEEVKNIMQTPAKP